MTKSHNNGLGNRLHRVFITCLVCTAGIACAPLPQQPVEERGALYFPPPPETPRFIFERTVQRSTDLASVEKRNGLRQALTGETSAGTALVKPFDVVACEGVVYVSDTVSRSVFVLSLVFE